MAQKGPKGWTGKMVTVYLYHAGTPDLGEQTSDLLAVDEYGVTMSGIPAPNVDFFPWTAIRQITLNPESPTNRR